MKNGWQWAAMVTDGKFRGTWAQS